jgi:hypothetical protein
LLAYQPELDFTALVLNLRKFLSLDPSAHSCAPDLTLGIRGGWIRKH